MERAVVWVMRASACAAMLLAACTTGVGREDAAVVRLRTLACERAQACACGQAEELCDDRLSSFGDLDPNGPDASPGAFDAQCLERWTQWVEQLDCNAEPPSYADLCPLYHGTQYEGMPCEQQPDDVNELLYSDCGRGLLCLQGQCRDPSGIALGTEGALCDLAQRCDEGLFCRDGLCATLPQLGQPCPDGRCASDAICDSVCLAPPGPGSPCLRGNCRSDAYCDGGQCQFAGEVGDPCFGHRECQSGNCPAGFCEHPAGAGDPCDFQLPCGPGFQCSSGTCQPSPGGAGPTVSVCWMLPEV